MKSEEDDLIKRNVAISYAISGLVRRIDGEYWIRLSEVKQSLKDVPAVEQPRGKWLKDFRYLDVRCSICKNYALEMNDYPVLSNYCPHCGAEMEIEQ